MARRSAIRVTYACFLPSLDLMQLDTISIFNMYTNVRDRRLADCVVMSLQINGCALHPKQHSSQCHFIKTNSQPLVEQTSS